ncbi:MAG TPA: hypothetical protein VIT45_07530 [Allosphingosinicella sp.]
MIPQIHHFRLFAAMAAATLVAPAAAPISVIIASVMREGSADMLLFAPMILVMRPGLYGFALAFCPVLLLGTALTAASLRFPALRPKRVWLATGAFFGILIGLALFPGGWDMVLYSGIAGAACALAYRLIVGPMVRNLTESRARPGMEPR